MIEPGTRTLIVHARMFSHRMFLFTSNLQRRGITFLQRHNITLHILLVKNMSYSTTIFWAYLKRKSMKNFSEEVGGIEIILYQSNTNFIASKVISSLPTRTSFQFQSKHDRVSAGNTSPNNSFL